MKSLGGKTYIANCCFAAALIGSFFSLAPNSPYAQSDFAALANFAQNMATYVETVNKNGLPDADTFHRYIEKSGYAIADFRRPLRKRSAKALRKAKGYILIFDETHEPYYGKKKDMWVHEYKPEKGCTGSYRFMCMHLLAPGGTRIFLDAVPMSVFSNRVAIISEMIEFSKKSNRKIMCILFDRGFYDSKIIEMLNLLRVNYLMLVPKIGNIPKVLESNRRRTFTVKDYLVDKKAKTDITVLRDEKFDWVFASNCKFMHKRNMIKLYKKRWNIETGFRVCDEARIKTKSRHIEVRYFVFLCGIMMYNAWKEIYPTMTFKRLIQEMADEPVRRKWIRRGMLCGIILCISVLASGRNIGSASYGAFPDAACIEPAVCA